MRRTRPHRLVIACLALAALAACGGPWPDGDPVADATALTLHQLVNEARSTARSCGTLGWFGVAQPLALEPRLTRAAQLHAEDMRDSGRMSHTGSDGSDLRERIERQGYAWGSAGENVAWGDRTPEAVMAGWLASDGHCANLMHDGFVDLGAGESGSFWTLVFARPR